MIGGLISARVIETHFMISCLSFWRTLAIMVLIIVIIVDILVAKKKKKPKKSSNKNE